MMKDNHSDWLPEDYEHEIERLNKRIAETVKMFDYWAFHDDGKVQFFQICEGALTDYREYDRAEDAPIALIDEQSWNPDFVGPINGLRYHGRSYISPAHSGQGEK